MKLSNGGGEGGSATDDYHSIYSNYTALANNALNGKHLIGASSISNRTDCELEKLITEKLNQRYNQQRKKESENLPKNNLLSAHGGPSGGNIGLSVKMKSAYTALNESGVSN